MVPSRPSATWARPVHSTMQNRLCGRLAPHCPLGATRSATAGNQSGTATSPAATASASAQPPSGSPVRSGSIPATTSAQPTGSGSAS